MAPDQLSARVAMPRPRQKTSNQKSSGESGSATTEQKTHVCCPVVGIGASAGGLVAFKKFFTHMPDDSGMAFVLVPHLDPSHQSLMVELLSRQTEMPVCEASDGQAIEANHVYIIPPAKYLAIENSKLQLSRLPQPSRIETAIDHFLGSLADDQAERAIGIILSGTSSHGSAGLQAIKANGGMVMAQQPETAEYDAMPQNAIDTGIVDYILPPEEMPATLIRYVQHAYVSGAWQPMEPAKTELEELDRVLGLLRARTRYDFRYYRKNMIMRRVQRRMGLHQIDQLKDYCDFLRESPDEAKLLFRDLLIGVTGFFREPEAYKVLEQRVIPQWIERKDSDTPIRIWIPGCASGEEAYSIAMLLIEQFSAAQKPLNLQIFATDIDETALEFARQGSYPVSIAADITPERLTRFFTQTGSHYRVTKQVREYVVFAAQNLISDAPFSKLDLISCRNLLIYLEPEVQRKVISLFHFALNEDGHLFLGSSETVGRHFDLFETVSKKWRIFRRIGPTRRDIVKFPITTGYERRGMLQSAVKPLTTHEVNFAELTKRHLLDDYAPASALINRKYEVLYFQGPTGDFLEPPSGEPTHDLIAMARQGLQTKLRAACHKAIRENQTIFDTSPRVKRNNRWYPCTITVKPIVEPKQAEGLLLVTFQQRETIEPALTDAEAMAPVEESSLVRQLEYELKATRDDLQSTIEDMESSNEELKASNEEIMSMNEELQSANEELETSKEELQSLNEELSTVNSQLQDKVEELDKAHNDMTNLLNSADIATLFLDTELCIRQFTPATGKLLGLISSDAGRPISTFATDFTGESLLQDAREVLEKLAPLENELTASNGRHYLRRTLPYRTSDNRIDGLVVTFIDITQRIKSEQQARRMATVLHDSNDAISVLGLDGHITAWNHGAEQLYGYSEAEALKMNISDLVPADKRTQMQKILQQTASGEQIKSLDTVRLSKNGRTLDVWITLTPLYDESGQPIAVATTERDISERVELDTLRVQTDRLLRMVDHLPAGAVYRENDHLMINRTAEKITGYSRDELATLDQWFHKLYGEREQELRRQYQIERAAGFPRQTGPIALTRKDGEQRFIEYAAYKFDDHEVWIMHDVSKRQESETALRDREQRLRAVMDNAAEAIIVIGTDGLITDFNNAAEKLFGYGAEETINHNVSMLMPSPYCDAHDGYLARYLKTGEPRIINQSRELPGRRKDGSTFPMELTVTEVDHLGAFVGIIRDLGEQKALQRQVADISTQEQERIGQEIHDGLGQQLTGLSMVATSIKRSLASKNLPEAEKLEELITQLQLAITEARALSRGLAPVPITPEGLTDALSLLARDVKSKTGIDCTFEAHDTVDIKDRTNAMQIYRIAQEAVNNAVKHAQASKISIYLDGIADMCELTVSDNGCGFETEKAMSDCLGIRIMRYRAGIIGCELEVKSTVGNGTVVRCRRAAISSTE
jgi:two-component system CheB/CheR fusion protein